MPANAELATLGGGCFWCQEPLFAALRGVSKVESGYSRGKVKNPAYREVCAGTTGHAEVVQITFDPGVISYQELLEIFFSIHDPTTLNRQGNDAGTQYRSVVFYHNSAQKETAGRVIKEVNASGDWPAPLVTEITPFSAFYRAEDYHQDYYARNGNQPYCQLIITPKVKKFRERYNAKLKS